MAEKDFHFIVNADWREGFKRFKYALTIQGLSAAEFADLMGINEGYITHILRETLPVRTRSNATKTSTIARKIVDVLEKDDLAHNWEKYQPIWNDLKPVRTLLSSNLNELVCAARDKSSNNAIDRANHCQIPQIRQTPHLPPHATDAPPNDFFDDLKKRPKVRSTNYVDDLCLADAGWRENNLAPGEIRWLQISLIFGEAFTRFRTRFVNAEVVIKLHRVYVDVQLDGAIATEREPIRERFDADGSVIEVVQMPKWSEKQPAYAIDNPKRNQPIAGRYHWFDLCAVSGDLGDNAFLEVSTAIGSISAPIPPEILAQLDPDKQDGSFDAPEERLISGWLRHVTVPKARLSSGGKVQLAQIALSNKSV
jgi:hypothetical protein